MTAAIYYPPDGYKISGPKLMGRHAAGESFLRGYLLHAKTDKFWVHATETQHAQDFSDTVRRYHPDAEKVAFISSENLNALAEPGTLYYPGPDISLQARYRSIFGSGQWSLCGITHTTASSFAMDSISQWLTAPVQPWDAIICPSDAVKSNVEKILEAEFTYLEHRLGVTQRVMPQLPVIPLGIHTADFQYSVKDKVDSRIQLGIPADSIVILYVGRLSFHAKAHPLAMYQALSDVAASTGKDIHLIECGWHNNDFIKEAFEQASTSVCPNVTVTNLDGRDAVLRNQAWAAADIFCSLSDNIQETFGITPLEAMAAGLPVVVSDWNGYRSMVRDGKDGYRIPTTMPQAGLGADLANRHALKIDNYDVYCGFSSAFVSVDIAAVTTALVNLVQSEDLRRAFGEAGRQRAQTLGDWGVVIDRYESLWDSLNDLRLREQQQFDEPRVRWPARMDPFEAFSGYPTAHLSVDQVFVRVDISDVALQSRMRQLFDLEMVKYVRAIWPTNDELQRIFEKCREPTKGADLLRDFDPSRRPVLLRSLAFLMKLGLLRIYS